MTPMDELPDNPYEDGLDDSAFQGAADMAGHLASRAGHALARKALEKLGLEKIKLILIEGALILFLVIIAILLLFGGVSYLQALGEQVWYDITHRNVGNLGDDYRTTYYDEAQAVLDAINDGTLDIGNDMAMLTKEDMIMILEYVIKYNEETSYETTPEKIRWQYQQREYVAAPSTTTGTSTGGTSASTTTAPTTYVPSDWRTVYGFHTVSYQTLGKNYINPCTGENDFAVPWQTIVVLCEMMAESNYENFGSDEDGWKAAYAENFDSDLMFNTPMDGYFVTDKQVNALCSMVSYSYNVYAVYNDMDYVQWTREIVKDGTAHYADDLTYGIDLPLKDMHEFTYEIREPFSEGSGADKVDYCNMRVPELAPYSITNFYTIVSYDYEKVTSEEFGEVDMCTSMTITTDARRFMLMVRELIPDFTFQHFFELMEQMPGTEKEIEKYRAIEELYNQGEAARLSYETTHNTTMTLETITDETVLKSYQSTSIIDEEFPGEDVVVGTESQGRSEGGDDFEGANAVWIGTHYNKDGTVALADRLYGTTYANAAYNDWFQVDPAANVDMSHSDELTLEEVKAVLQEVGSWISKQFHGDLRKHFLAEETAQALYDWQNEEDASITAVLAIAYTEGELFIDGDAHKDWNFFNFTDNDYKKIYTGLPEYKTESEAFRAALIAQMNMINDNYIKSPQNGQNTYFKMQFGSDFSSDVPGQAYYQTAEASIKHSYCLWWQDEYFPIIAAHNADGNTTGAKMLGEGWCNNCAATRRNLLSVVGKQLEASFVWPVPDYTRVSSEFGPRKSPTAGASTDHKGMDIAAPRGSDILAIADGTVINDTSVWSDSVGYSVRIQHSDGVTQSRYIHMEVMPVVNNGDIVAKGQKIAEIGSGGISTGPHLHIEVKEHGVLVDPRKYISEP